MHVNPLTTLRGLGQSLWLDFMSRDLIASGALSRMIEEDGILGAVSSAATFAQAIADSAVYDEAISELAQQGANAGTIAETLMVEDALGAADALRHTFDRLHGHDGFVSLALPPSLAHDTDGSIHAGRRLSAAMDRPNVMIEVPATREGLPAVRQLIADGINVNATLILSLPRYRDVVEAYIAGLEERARQIKPLLPVASVAGFSLRRIDERLDPMLEEKARMYGATGKTAAAVRGHLAVATAKLAYSLYKQLFATERFRRLESGGARPQRLLWAGADGRNRAEGDLKYVEALIGPETVNALPRETLAAYRNHGQPALKLEADIEEAGTAMEHLPRLEIDIDQAVQTLEEQSIDESRRVYDKLIDTIDAKRADALASDRPGRVA